MTPEELIGPAAAKALAEHFDLTPKAKPLPEVVTMADVLALQEAYRYHWEAVNGTAPKAGRFDYSDRYVMRLAAESLFLRWLRARLIALPNATSDGCAEVFDPDEPASPWFVHRADTYRAIAGREWAE